MARPKKIKDLPVIGRPSKYFPVMDEQAFKFALLGWNDKEIYEFFDISHQTFIDWKKRHPSFLDAIIRGRGPATAEVANAMYQAALGYQHESEEIHVIKDQVVRVRTRKKYAPDTKAGMFFLRNKQQRDWKGNPEVTAAPGSEENTIRVHGGLPDEKKSDK